MVSLQKFASKLFGSSNERKLKTYDANVEAINALEPEIEKLSDAKLKARTAEFRKQLEEGATLSTSLIPWTTAGAFYAGVLGLSALEYAPWAFFNYINAILSVILAYMGFGIFRQSKNGGR